MTTFVAPLQGWKGSGSWMVWLLQANDLQHFVQRRLEWLWRKSYGLEGDAGGGGLRGEVAGGGGIEGRGGREWWECLCSGPDTLLQILCSSLGLTCIFCWSVLSLWFHFCTGGPFKQPPRQPMLSLARAGHGWCIDIFYLDQLPLESEVSHGYQCRRIICLLYFQTEGLFSRLQMTDVQMMQITLSHTCPCSRVELSAAHFPPGTAKCKHAVPCSAWAQPRNFCLCKLPCFFFFLLIIFLK